MEQQQTTREAQLQAAQMGMHIKDNLSTMHSAALNGMLHQRRESIKTRGEAKEDFDGSRKLQEYKVPFVRDEWGENIKVKNLDKYLTDDGKRLVLQLLAQGRMPNHEEQAFLMADYEAYRAEHFEDVYMREHRIENAKQKCNVLVLFASEILDDMLLEMLWSLDKCKAISHHHKSIPIRKRLSDFCRKTYRHARNKEMERLADKDSALDSSDRFKEQYIDPLWTKVTSYMETRCRETVAKDPGIAAKLKKMDMSVDTMVQFDQVCEFARVFMGMMHNVDRYLIAAGFPENFKLPTTYDSMLNAVEMLRNLGKLLFTDTLVGYEQDIILPLENELLTTLFDDNAITEASCPGLLNAIEQQRENYKALRANHPDMNDEALYKEFYRLYPDISMEKKIAHKVGGLYNEAIQEAFKGKTITKKDGIALWKKVCETGDKMLKPYIEEETIMYKKCGEKIKQLHPEYDEAAVEKEVDATLKIGLRLHPTASYDVLHMMLRLAMPMDMQDIIKQAEEKRQLANAKRRAKRAAAKGKH